MKKILLYCTLFACVIAKAQDYPIIDIIGTAVKGDWENFKNLETDDGVTYYLKEVKLSQGELKFRQNNSWTINWGRSESEVVSVADDFESGMDYYYIEGKSGIVDGGNIQIPVNAVYNIAFNLQNYSYEISTHIYPRILVLGSATDNKPVYLRTDNGVDYSKSNIALQKGSLLIERSYGTAKVWGKAENHQVLISAFDEPISLVSYEIYGNPAVENGEDIDIPVMGLATIRFNLETLSYHIGIEDNHLEVSDISIPNNKNISSTITFTNPVNEIIELSHPAHIQIYDQNGRFLKYSTGEKQIDVSDLSSGNYILKTDYDTFILVVN